MALVERLLKATFVLGQGTFGEDGSDTVEVDGLRMSARIARAGGPAMGNLDLQIYGMTLEVMNHLSTLGMIRTTLRRNSVTLTAGDLTNGMAVAFQGTINDGYVDLQSAPDAVFRISASEGLIDALAPAAVSSFVGSNDVATILQGLANLMHVRFENNGVTARLSNAYYYGSARDQALRIVQDAGIEWNGIENGVLAIWNPGESRGQTTVRIAKDTGLVGYPAYTSNGIMMKTLYNPSLGLGVPLTVESRTVVDPTTRLPSSGRWVAFDLSHDLSTRLPGGPWFTTIQASVTGLGRFVP